MRLAEFLPLAGASVSEPEAVFARLRALGLDRGTLWTALGAVCALGALLTAVMIRLTGVSGVSQIVPLGGSPLAFALAEAGAYLLFAFAIFRVGRMFGGRASFDDSLLVVVWVQAVLLAVQVVQFVALLVVPVVAVMLGWLGVGLFFWLFVPFIAAAHGFRSRGKVFAGLLASLLLLGIVLVFLLALTGALPVDLPAEFPDV